MKQLGLLFIFISFYHLQTHSQVNTVEISQELTTENNFKIPANSILVNTSTIVVGDTLYVYGKLINNGTIHAKNCIVKGGELYSEKANELAIEENIHFYNSITSSADTINEHLISFSADNIYIDEDTEMKSAHFTTNNLYINAALEFSGKLGVKTILNDFIINENGTFQNSNNENIQLYGNAYNYSNKICKKGNFELFGIDKGFYGEFSCYRFDLEENTQYTNYGKLTITDAFSGKGTLIQAENSYLNIHTKTSSKIQASAIGNTIEFTRGGEQFLNTNECYNLIISKDGDNFLSLSQNTTILNSLQFNKKSYLNCNGFQLTFPQATGNSISIDNTKNDKGIILNDGNIYIENLSPKEQIYFPLYTNDTIYAGIQIANRNETPIKFAIDSCFHLITKTGKSISKKYNTDFVNLTWHIVSDDNVYLTLYWNTAEELYIFDKNTCTIYQSEGMQWEDIECVLDNFPTTMGTGSHYYSVGNKTIILPITLSEFFAETDQQQTVIHWKLESNVDELFLEKSYDGIHFTRIADLPTNTCSNTYYDTFSSNHIQYYRLVSHTNDTEEYSSIICVPNIPKKEILITTDKIQVTNTNKNVQISLYNQQGKCIKNGTSNTVFISDIPKGIYYLHIKVGTENYIQSKFFHTN